MVRRLEEKKVKVEKKAQVAETESLEYLLPKCGSVKASLKELKAEETSLVDLIKKVFTAQGITQAEAGGYKAETSVATSFSWIMPKLIEKIKAAGLAKKLLIPTVEVDTKLLEDMFMSGELNKVDFASCLEKSEQSRLTIKAIK